MFIIISEIIIALIALCLIFLIIAAIARMAIYHIGNIDGVITYIKVRISYGIIRYEVYSKETNNYICDLLDLPLKIRCQYYWSALKQLPRMIKKIKQHRKEAKEKILEKLK